ncbi:MAG: NAD(P)-dependent oxidoreductase [Steroidobacteraceae bacterium]
MKVALIGASGNAGSRILAELVRRGHQVLALVRHPEKVPALEGVAAVPAEANDVAALSNLLTGADAVVSSVKFKDTETQGLIEAVRRARVKRYLVVGGAGSLEVAPGLREVDSPEFPPHVRPEALKGAEFLDQLRRSDLDWTFLSPSRIFFAGTRTGKFRLGNDQLLFDKAGKSSISLEDYAIALVDELERPRHIRARFTVGY